MKLNDIDSLCTRSTGRGTLQGTRPFEERAPLMHRMDERRREKDRRHRNHPMVWLYDEFHLEASQSARRL